MGEGRCMSNTSEAKVIPFPSRITDSKRRQVREALTALAKK